MAVDPPPPTVALCAFATDAGAPAAEAGALEAAGFAPPAAEASVGVGGGSDMLVSSLFYLVCSSPILFATSRDFFV